MYVCMYIYIYIYTYIYIYIEREREIPPETWNGFTHKPPSGYRTSDPVV